MNWLLNNPISEMDGPTFLGLYGAAIVLFLVEAAWRMHRADPGSGMDPESIPKQANPLEIAYLRGGENEVTRLIVFDLIRRGFLQVDGFTVRLSPTQPDYDSPTKFEGDVLAFFQKERKPADLFRSGGLAAQIRGELESIRDGLLDRD